MARRRTSARPAPDRLAIAMGLIIAAALAFFIAAMPADLLESLVVASGLPHILTVAQPPLDVTTRAIVALGAALISGFLVFRGFRLGEAAPDSPMMAHREPIRATEELGSVSLAPDSGSHHSVVDALEAVARRFERPYFELAEVRENAPDFAEFDELPEDPAPRLYFDLAAIRAASDASSGELLDLGQWPTIVESELAETTITPPEEERPAAEPCSVSPNPPGFDPIPEPDIGPVIETACDPVPKAEAHDESISALMRRLEEGLASRNDEGVKPAHAPAIEPMGPRLRSTLDELRRMASRG